MRDYKLSSRVIRGSNFVKTAKGMLVVSCWCERELVWMTERDVFEGRTASCGHRECKP